MTPIPPPVKTYDALNCKLYVESDSGDLKGYLAVSNSSWLMVDPKADFKTGHLFNLVKASNGNFALMCKRGSYSGFYFYANMANDPTVSQSDTGIGCWNNAYKQGPACTSGPENATLWKFDGYFMECQDSVRVPDNSKGKRLCYDPKNFYLFTWNVPGKLPYLSVSVIVDPHDTNATITARSLGVNLLETKTSVDREIGKLSDGDNEHVSRWLNE